MIIWYDVLTESYKDNKEKCKIESGVGERERETKPETETERDWEKERDEESSLTEVFRKILFAVLPYEQTREVHTL